MPPKPTIFTGEDIRRERERRGMTVEELAYRAEISYRTIDRTEAGGTAPRRATLAMIERAFAERDELTANGAPE